MSVCKCGAGRLVTGEVWGQERDFQDMEQQLAELVGDLNRVSLEVTAHTEHAKERGTVSCCRL